MANTLCIVLVATLFVLGNAIPLSPGVVKGYIHKKSGETRGAVNKELGEAVKEAKMQATTDVQRTCIDTLRGSLFNEGNAAVGLTTKKLINLADSHSADLPNATMDDIQKAVDSQYAKIVNQWLPEKVAELKRC